MSIDASGIHELSAVIRSANIAPGVKRVVSKGSLKIKNQIKRDFRASKHFKGVTDVSYKLGSGVGYVEGIIAPYVENEGYGSLTGIAIHGTSRGGGGTVADPMVALKAEESFFVDAIGDVLGKVLD